MKMKRLIILLLAVCLIFTFTATEYTTAYAAGSTAEKTVKVLFVGNSFTRRNNLHKIFKGIAKADGTKVKAKRLAFGGYKLRKYSSSKTKAGKKLRKLLKKDWDYVVLQGYSSEFVKSYNKNTYKAVSKLIDMVRESGAEPVLYMTWAKEEGMKVNNRTMQTSLDKAEATELVSDMYYKIGNEFGVKVAPVGQNFLRCAEEYPEVKLMTDDLKHPTFAGSYLAACTIYETIFEKSVLGNEYYTKDGKKVGIGKKKATKLQHIADVRMSIDKNHLYLEPGATAGVDAKIKVSAENDVYLDKYNGKDHITYTSNDPSVATVDKNGRITALSKGETYIRAQSDSGLSVVTTVEVKSRNTFELFVNSGASIYGKDFINYTLSWPKIGNETQTEVYRSILNKNHFVLLGRVSGERFIDRDALKGKKYIYKVVCYRKTGGVLKYSGESLTRTVYDEK